MKDWIHKDGYSTKLLADDSDLSSPNTQIEIVHFNKGKYEHYHKQKTEFFYFIKGMGKMIVDGKEHEIRPGSSFLLKPNMVHAWVNESSEPLEAIMLKTNNSPEDTFTE